MKALVISQHFPPELDPEALVTGKFVSALAETGISCEIVCGPPLGPIAPARCWDGLFGRHQVDIDQRRLLRRLKHVKARLKNFYFGKISGWTLGAQNACEQLMLEHQFEFIMTRAGSEDETLVGYNLWRKTKVPWVAYFGDPPVTMGPPPYCPEKRSWHDYPSLSCLRRILPQIPMAMFPSQRLADYYRNVLGIDLGDNVAIIPHIGWRAGSDDERSVQRAKKLRIMHIGGLGRHRVAVDALLGLDRAIRDSCISDLIVEMIFVGTPEQTVISYLNEHQLKPTVRFVPPVSYEDSLRLMAEADALLLIEANLAEGIFLPSKFCDYAVSDKPILMYSPERGTIADIVGGYNHPGFMGQTAEGAEAVFHRLLSAAADAEGLEAFRVSGDPFHPEEVCTKFLRVLHARVDL